LLTATVLAKTYPDGGTERYEHDAAGQLIRRIRPDGTAASHSYDSRGRLLSVKWNADRSEPITYTYDVAGRMTSASNTSATVARSYTATGRLATETQTIRLPDLTQPVENRLTYDYSPDGRLAAITYPDASKVQHYHNARGELIEIIDTQPMAGLDANNARYTYTRRADGKITALTHPNGVTTTRDYDEVGRLAKITHLDPTGKVLESEASTYDQRDRRLTRTRADGSTDLFRYDPAGQVTAAAYAQASDPQNPNPVNPSENPVNPVEKSDEAEQKDFTPNQTFVYDEAGNRLEVTENGMITKYQPNDANQYAKIAHGTEVVEPEYDPQGNLLHDATRKYTWDADIHLTAVSTQTGQPGTKNPEQRTEFKYDPLHRRIARVKDSGAVTLYVYEGWNVIAEKTEQKAPQLAPENFKLETRYTWGEDLSGSLQGAGGIGGLLSSTLEQSPTKNEAQRTTNCFHYDSNANIILLTDAQANDSARYAYDAFGKTLTATGPAAQSNRYRFSTKPVEEESGLVYYGYRWYDPLTGRWPSRDPIEERGGVNLYGMVGNGMVNLSDYFGLFFDCDGCRHTGGSHIETETDTEWMILLASILNESADSSGGTNPLVITWNISRCYCKKDCGYGKIFYDFQFLSKTGLSKSGSVTGAHPITKTASEAAYETAASSVAHNASVFSSLCEYQCAVLARDEDILGYYADMLHPVNL